MLKQRILISLAVVVSVAGLLGALYGAQTGSVLFTVGCPAAAVLGIAILERFQ